MSWNPTCNMPSTAEAPLTRWASVHTNTGCISFSNFPATRPHDPYFPRPPTALSPWQTSGAERGLPSARQSISAPVQAAMYESHHERAQLRLGLSSDNPPQRAYLHQNRVGDFAQCQEGAVPNSARVPGAEHVPAALPTAPGNSPWHPAEQLRAAGEVVRALVEQVEALHKQVLPAFELPGNALPAAERPGAPAVDESRVSDSGDDLFRQVQRLEQALGLLRMIVDAKSQTMSIARDRLQEENSALRSQLETRETSGIPEVVVPEVVDAAQWRQERRLLRHEMAALQKLYDEELMKLRAGKEDEGHAAVQTTSGADNSGPDTPQVEQADSSGSQSREEMHEAALLQAQAHAKEAQMEADRMREELEMFKLSQKFMVDISQGARIPAEKLELMRMVNALTDEVKRLKTEKEQMNAAFRTQRKDDAKAHAQQVAAAKLHSPQILSKTKPQIRLSEEEMTAKLLRQQILAQSPAPAGHSLAYKHDTFMPPKLENVYMSR